MRHEMFWLYQETHEYTTKSSQNLGRLSRVVDRRPCSVHLCRRRRSRTILIDCVRVEINRAEIYTETGARDQPMDINHTPAAPCEESVVFVSGVDESRRVISLTPLCDQA